MCDIDVTPPGLGREVGAPRSGAPTSCFVCGELNPRGLHLHFEAGEKGVVSARWRPSREFEGFPGVIHGGIVSTVLDEAMSKAVASLGRQAFTCELRARLRRHVESGTSFTVQAWVVEKRKRRVSRNPPMKETESTAEYDCASCEHHLCREGVDCFALAERASGVYAKANAADINITEAAARVEAQGYMRWPRALEIIRFAEAAGFSHLGIAFCIGLAEEARTYEEMLKKRFRVSSICCKNCGLPKSEFHLEQIHPEEPHETMCAPLCQADILNRAGTELNVMIGLCVGHDALFARHSAAPVTTLVAKDRVLGHNPVAALYSQYWRKRLLDGDGLA